MCDISFLRYQCCSYLELLARMFVDLNLRHLHRFRNRHSQVAILHHHPVGIHHFLNQHLRHHQYHRLLIDQNLHQIRHRHPLHRHHYQIVNRLVHHLQENHPVNFVDLHPLDLHPLHLHQTVIVNRFVRLHLLIRLDVFNTILLQVQRHHRRIQFLPYE